LLVEHGHAEGSDPKVGITSTELRGLPLYSLETFINDPAVSAVIETACSATDAIDLRPSHVGLDDARREADELPIEVRTADLRLEIPPGPKDDGFYLLVTLMYANQKAVSRSAAKRHR
jgi:hypothetical protein